jgi:hypothetical protein
MSARPVLGEQEAPLAPQYAAHAIDGPRDPIGDGRRKGTTQKMN